MPILCSESKHGKNLDQADLVCHLSFTDLVGSQGCFQIIEQEQYRNRHDFIFRIKHTILYFRSRIFVLIPSIKKCQYYVVNVNIAKLWTIYHHMDLTIDDRFINK